MDLGMLVASLPKKKSAVYTLERGKPVTHTFAAMAGDVARATADLKRWGARRKGRRILMSQSFHPPSLSPPNPFR